MAVRVVNNQYVIGDEDPHSMWNMPQEEILALYREAQQGYKDSVRNYVGDFIKNNPDVDFANLDIQRQVYADAEKDPNVRQAKDTWFMYDDALMGTTDPKLAQSVRDKTYRRGGVTVVGAVDNTTEPYRVAINRALTSHLPEGTLVVAGHGETGEDFPAGSMSDFPFRRINDEFFPTGMGAVYREALAQNPDATCAVGAHCSGGGLSDTLLGQLNNLAAESGKAIIIPGGFNEGLGSGARNTSMDTNNPLGYITSKTEDPANITVVYPFATKVYTFKSKNVPYKQALQEVFASPEYKKYLEFRTRQQRAST